MTTARELARQAAALTLCEHAYRVASARDRAPWDETTLARGFPFTYDNLVDAIERTASTPPGQRLPKLSVPQVIAGGFVAARGHGRWRPYEPEEPD